MESNSKISILFPVYNKEKYLNRSINSILAQSYSDWELIAVDDGSSDSSGRILDKYSSGDSRIKVIHKSNGGVASALNCALSLVEGSYVTRCDPDDYVEDKWLLSMFNAIQQYNVDMVRFRSILEMEDGTVRKPDFTDKCIILNSNQAIGAFIEHRIINGVLNNCLFKVELFDGITFDEKMKVLEDDKVMIQILLRINSMARIDNAQYHYCIYNNSLSNSPFTPSKYDCLLHLWDYVISLCPSAELQAKAQKKKAFIRYNALCSAIKSQCVDYRYILMTIFPGVIYSSRSVLQQLHGFCPKLKFILVILFWPLLKALCWF